MIWSLEAVNHVFVSKEHLFMQAALTMFWVVNSLSSLLTRETASIVNAKQADLISSFAGRQVIYVLSGFFLAQDFVGRDAGMWPFSPVAFFLEWCCCGHCYQFLAIMFRIIHL
ncbi:hypothetical protein [Kistimonas asteriae]|uniref:hypothetical protein n=1 Tax=Kistimonas asteriae TaxID=517724 RepID=UPI001FECB366|nr:hypothetical protein [Kistimonas asteriae]